ncbi:MAG: 1-deoxy-D-xylulose-5-phosphate synthase [Gammaproteobacteria bacterium]|jgi:1-deoxy-D-xylulose-5-phosphate synthase
MTKNPDPPLLPRIESPRDLRALKPSQLPQLAAEARHFLIDTVSRTGGHLAANLGTVELTLALHYVFDTPEDRLVWDVGHQSYLHKIITGRRERMDTLRQKGGLAGFPRREESPYDSFGVGHSSTSISAALGMAIAAARSDSQRRVVAVIGDGAMTAGQAFEALNHAGTLDANLLVVLNDNDMSISPNVGGLSNYLARVLSGRTYSTVREGSKKVLAGMPTVWELARRAEEHMKGMVIPGTLFEELGFNYIGPIDGHDTDALIRALGNLRGLRGPQLLHVVTRKGKGFAPAEENPCKFHGVGKFDPDTGRDTGGGASLKTYTQVFSDWICDMAQADRQLVAITPAMREGSGLVAFSERFPARYFDVGIAEQHSVTLAAGMACDGLRPVVAIYSTFLQRAYDQLIHDVSLQNLPVLFAIDRGGLVGNDGPTHSGNYDLSYLRCIPNMTVMTPADENECRRMLSTGFELSSPAAVRYPRGTGPGVATASDLARLPVGKAEIRRDGRDVALLVFGSPLAAALEAAERLDATVINMRFVKPMDEECLLDTADRHHLLVTIEDNAIAGGAGSAVAEVLAAHDIVTPLTMLGIPDRYLEHASREQQLAECGLDATGIYQRIQREISRGIATLRAVD